MYGVAELWLLGALENAILIDLLTDTGDKVEDDKIERTL